MDTIEIIQPDDWHLHLRDDEYMRAVLAHTAARFGRAIVMPNLRPPVTGKIVGLLCTRNKLCGRDPQCITDSC